MIGIYKITSPTNKVYIGQSIDIKRRFKTYKSINKSKEQIKIHRSFLKYGIDKHKFEIICECEISELNDKERYYQDFYDAIGKNGLNCNLTTSSYRNGKHSEETKLKISIAKKGKKHTEQFKIKMSETQKNRDKSINIKISQTLKGRIFSTVHKNKLSEIQKKIILNLETGIFYIGINEASKSLNMKYGTLKSQLNGKNPNKTNLIYV